MRRAQVFIELRSVDARRGKVSETKPRGLGPHRIDEVGPQTDAIAELVNLLATNGEVKEPKKVLDSVLDREATRTTGIGNGLAIPHGKCKTRPRALTTPVDAIRSPRKRIAPNSLSPITMLGATNAATASAMHRTAQETRMRSKQARMPKSRTNREAKRIRE